MNIAFYLNTTAESDLQKQIFSCLNDAIENFKVEDASLFYNNPSHSSGKCLFGLFNSTELWAYTGLLITTTLEGAAYAINIANKFKPAYLFTKEKNIMGLMFIGNKIPVLVTSKEDEQEVYRLTGKMPKLVELKAESLIEALQ